MGKKNKRKNRDVHGDIAANIRNVSSGQGISLNQLADVAGISRSQLFNVLAGTSSPTVGWLDQVAETLNVDVVELISG